ncbi:MAG: SH3 domain-containing protein [Alphaproteobacteria bacterium]|nr:SH3 domain-containing protein [Alphaproteobacteria bacterium]
MASKNRLSRIFFLVAVALALVSLAAPGVHAQADAASPAKAQNPYRSTDLPLPRFVSLGSDEVHVRAGPGQKYPIKWTFSRAGLPVEIILEFENWRKIRDHDGQEGWVFHTLLIGRRTAIIEGEGEVPVYERPFYDESKKSNVNIKLEPFVSVNLEECKPQWCKIETSGYHGWIERKVLWGIYEGELFD